MKFNRLILFTLLLYFIFPLMSNADQLEDAKAAIINKNFIDAHKLLTPLVEENKLEAQTLLGTLYVNGQGVEKDLEKGLSLIMKAANHGFKDARVMALKLHIDLANQGDMTAMYNVGYMCLNRWGGERDPNVCLKWLETAAKMGHEKSEKILSRIYAKGLFGVTPDEEKATYWRNQPTNSAMLIMDVQKAFTGMVCRKQLENMIPVINRLIDKFVKKNIDIIYITQSYKYGVKLDSRLKIVGDKIFNKEQSNAFSIQKFTNYLNHSQIRHLYITGIAAEYCVLEAVNSALESGYAVTVISDAIAAKDCSSLNISLDRFRKLGAKVLRSEEL
jgi:TPR repeat protein/diacylglycerol kinase